MTTSQSSPHRQSLPSHLLWRSLLGASAAWSGSSSRGVYLADSNDDHDNNDGAMLQSIPTDGRRMFHLPISLRDAIVDFTLPPLTSYSPGCHSYLDDGNTMNGGSRSAITPCHSRTDQCHHRYWKKRRRENKKNKSASSSSSIRLLSRPRIVGATPLTTTSTNAFFHSTTTVGRRGGGNVWSSLFAAGGGMSNEGIACMDLDRGHDANYSTSGSSSPPRYLLVGSGGVDCSIALYDLSCFGSDSYLYHHPQQRSSLSSSISSHNLSSLQKHHSKESSLSTHRPIARSLRQQHNVGMSSSSEEDVPENDVHGVPSGHRHPLRGVHWYPADVYGAFVSASISGEILVWDAQNFVPVFATYSHVYSSTSNNSNNQSSGWLGRSRTAGGGGKSVATIQCTDLPKTPEGCPHGSALLALGLGGVDGRGVIQLCDAFRGGSATHELIGHSRNAGGGGGGGGVNAIAWDPYHPFRLASGGDDCTVRLWDIRKAGAAACLGVLDKENGANCGDSYYSYCTLPTRKRQKASTCISMMSKSHNNNNNNVMNGIESHEAPVTAITFAPYGDDLVSAALDGQIKHWDLRPDSCFTSSFAAARDNTKRTLDSCSGGDGGGGRGGVDPSVAYSGRLLPTSFFGNDGNFGNATPKPPSHRRQTIRHNKSSSLAIIQHGTRTTATLLSTTAGQITGHSLFGRRSKEPGGYPDFILDGHLADVTCLVPVVGMWDNLARGQRCMGSNSSTSTSAVSTSTRVMFLTGGKDGMVLCWGCNSYFHRDDDESMMHRWERSEDENSNMSIPSSPLFSLLEEPAAAFEDVDTW